MGWLKEELEQEETHLHKESDMKKGQGSLKKGDYIICRTYSAGVFAGTLVFRQGKEVWLKNARRLWYWSGAASLSQLANEGVKHHDACKFPAPVPLVVLTEGIELLLVSPSARKSIREVPVWKV